MQTIEGAWLCYAELGERTVDIRASLPAGSWAFTRVREDTLVPDRPFLDGPPAGPPRGVA